jgi:hypothetical protein
VVGSLCGIIHHLSHTFWKKMVSPFVRRSHTPFNALSSLLMLSVSINRFDCEQDEKIDRNIYQRCILSDGNGFVFFVRFLRFHRDKIFFERRKTSIFFVHFLQFRYRIKYSLLFYDTTYYHTLYSTATTTLKRED